jgi:beta-glucosidase
MSVRVAVHAMILVGLCAAAMASAAGVGGSTGQPRDASRGGAASSPIYLDPAYTPAERASDLVSRMTTAEKASQTISSRAPAIPRLGIKPHGQWNEALHGVSRSQLTDNANATTLSNTTSYPIDQSLGASWDPSLIYRIGSAIGDEAREVSPDNMLNLEFYSPTLNLERDPRWGRTDETYAEDPLLTTKLVSQFVNGMEGKDRDGRLLQSAKGYNKVLTTIKHYAANNSEVNRRTGSSDMDDRTLREYYTAAFRGVVQASQPGSVMSSYNSVNTTSPAPAGGTSAKPGERNNPNGAPAAADPYLIDTLLRETFGFKGFVTSDCDAVFEMVRGHRWTIPRYPSALFARPVDNTERNALAQSAGEDSNCSAGFRDSFNYMNRLPEAAEAGTPALADAYTVNDLDNALARLLTARIRLGEFDDPGDVPWVTQARARVAPGGWVNSEANDAATETPERLALAREAGDKSIVLLKNSTTTRKDGNSGKLLPLRMPTAGSPRIAVIGFPACPAATGAMASVAPGAAVTSCPKNSNVYLGGYSSNQTAGGQAKIVPGFTGLKDAVEAINPNAIVDFWRGYIGTGTTIGSLTAVDPAAVSAAASYDVVVVYAGTDASTAKEETDRTAITLPGAQASLIHRVAARNPNTVVYMETIGPVDVSSFEPNLSSLLWSSYNGQRKGEALADVLLGTYDPSARTNSLWVRSAGQLPPITDYGIRPTGTNPGRTYQYFGGPVAYPFGYGLSYTTFSYSPLTLDSTTLDANDSLTVSVDVTNTGTASGEEVVQLYVTTPDAPSSAERPIKRLKGFEKVSLVPGQTKAVRFTLKGADLAFFDQRRGRWVVDQGRYGVQIARSSADVDIARTGTVTVTGRLAPTPSVIDVKPAMAGDAERDIAVRALFPEGVVVKPNVTVAMSDDTLYGYVRNDRDAAGKRISLSRDFPAGMSMTYASARPRVVRVRGDGTIETVSNGVATVTAKVSYRGVTKSTDFVVRVVSELKRITLDGRSLTSVDPDTPLRPDTFNYDVIVPDGAVMPPHVDARAGKGDTVVVAQATAIPGAARISVTGSDEVTRTYAVNFSRRAQSDEFNARLGTAWGWVRHRPHTERVTETSEEITAEPGDLNGAPNTGWKAFGTNTNNANNILLQNALGDWTIVSKLNFSVVPHVGSQQGGIIAYENDDNYLRLGWEYTNGVAQFALTSEDDRSDAAPICEVLATVPTAGVAGLGKTVWFKMVKSGSQYSSYYSTDGSIFTPIYQTFSSLRNVRVGVFAFNRLATRDDLTVGVDSFHVDQPTGVADLAARSSRGGLS